MTPHRMGPTTTAVPDGNRAALATAHAALRQGCHFLSARSEGDGSGGHRHARLRWRVAGNHLKELDRFLAVLLAEYAQATGHARPPLTPPIPDSLAPAPDSAEA
ncbi:MAG TPA: hypothetical protein VFF98_00310, partial [Novosphingobium sp.]|nr:hypothetical protein [Novosphingobium sp.]